MYADICKIFGIKYPIIQGAMAWISDADLVAAVSNAGGMGVLATGHLNGEECRKEIKRLKSMTDKPVSYTHLDVYKRQTILSTQFISI